MSNDPIKSENVPVYQRQLDLVRQELKSDITTVRLEMKSGFQAMDARFDVIGSQFKEVDGGNVYFGTSKGIYLSLSRYKTEEIIVPKIEITKINILNNKNIWNTNSSNKWINLPPQNYTFEENENQLTFEYKTINNKQWQITITMQKT